ncbi:hypothetical protein EDD15DRAFT_2192063 [Pisolithus albus]|nr:hypothetical protein EDD15DRAFT_2192063 [Pisolithus albus]
MPSPNRLTEHRGDDDVNAVVLSDLVDFLSRLSLNQTTANAVIMEIQAHARPSLFGMPPSSPVSFPVSPRSSHDSSSPQMHTFYPTSLYTPTPLLSNTHPTQSAPPREIHTKHKQAGIGAHGLPLPRVSAKAAPSSSTTVPANPPSSTVTTLKSELSTFTTVFGINNTTPTPCHFEVVPETLRSLGVVGNPKLQTFVLETPKGEKRWQQFYKGVYFDVPGPEKNGPFYLVTKGTQIGVLAEW